MLKPNNTNILQGGIYGNSRQQRVLSTILKPHKIFAFTLAEVLITLGIIGIVAAMVIPSLITDHKARVLRTQFKREQYVLSQAYKRALADDEIYFHSGNYSNIPMLPKPQIFARYLNGVVEGHNRQVSCQQKLANLGYKNFRGGNPDSWMLWFVDDGCLELNTGIVYFWENANNSANSYISADINGYKNGPNKWGVDLLTFKLDKEGIVPVGEDLKNYCNTKRNVMYNGLGCSYYAENDKYFFHKVLRNQPLE